MPLRFGVPFFVGTLAGPLSRQRKNRVFAVRRSNRVVLRVLAEITDQKLGHPEASAYCSQGERLLFRRGTRNLPRRFRRFLGRNRTSRRREAAGRRNYPEAVPNGKGGDGEDGQKQVLWMGARFGGTEGGKRNNSADIIQCSCLTRYASRCRL